MWNVDLACGKACSTAIRRILAVKLSASVVEQGAMCSAEAFCWVNLLEACDALLIALALALVATRVGKETDLESAVALAPQKFVAVGWQRFLGARGLGEEEWHNEEMEHSKQHVL